eukprot:gene8496-biopygen6130
MGEGLTERYGRQLILRLLRGHTAVPSKDPPGQRSPLKSGRHRCRQAKMGGGSYQTAAPNVSLNNDLLHLFRAGTSRDFAQLFSCTQNYFDTCRLQMYAPQRLGLGLTDVGSSFAVEPCPLGVPVYHGCRWNERKSERQDVTTGRAFNSRWNPLPLAKKKTVFSLEMSR